MMLALWAAGGLYALLGTMAVAELASLFPEAGGLYVYAREAFGEAVGVTIGWSDLVATSAAAASIAVTGSDFAVALWPGLAGMETVLSVLAVLFFATIQWQGIRTSGWVQEWTSILQAGALLILVGCCFLLGGEVHPAALTTPVRDPSWTALGGAFLAMRYIIMDYDGWYSAIYFSEEDRERGGGMGRSMVIGVLVIIACYIALNAAFLYVMPLSELAGSKLAAADVAQKLLGPPGAQAITLISLIMATAVIHPMLLMNTRLAFSMGRSGILWHKLAAVNKAGTPTFGLILSTSLIVFFAATGTFEKLSAIGSFMFVVNYGTSFLALVAIRKKAPELFRPFQAWGTPWTTFIAILASAGYLAGVAWNDPANSSIAILLLLLAYPVSRLIRKMSQ